MKKYTVKLEFNVYANTYKDAAIFVVKLLKDKDTILPEMEITSDTGHAFITPTNEVIKEWLFGEK